MEKDNPLWLKISFLLSFLGLSISGYATYHHYLVDLYGKTDASCNISQLVSCDTVALSRFSTFLGAPLGVWGLGYFWVMIQLCLFYLWKAHLRSQIKFFYGVMAVFGFFVCVLLAGISFGVLKVGCINCISIYLLTIGQCLAFGTWGNPKSTRFDQKIFGSLSVMAVLWVAILVSMPWIDSSHQKKNKMDISQKDLFEKIPVQEAILRIQKTPYKGAGEDYRKGPDDAKVVIVKFSDFQCPACRTMAQTLDQLIKEFPKDLLVVYRNYPLDQSCNQDMPKTIHPHACEIALLARCAGEKKLFWPYHDLAFMEQEDPQPQVWAKKIGLSDQDVEACLKNSSFVEKIREDVIQARGLAIKATPTIFVNGREVQERDYDTLKTLLNELI